MSYANAWLKWFPVIEAGATPLTRRMLERVCLTGSESVLDVGTGIGEPALSAAARLDDGGRVVAIDRDPLMIELARQRADSLGIENVEYRIGDADSLSLETRRFDVILARWSLMFVVDLPAVLQTLHAALRPGGRLAIATWATAERVPSLTLAKRTTHAHFGWAPPDYGAGTPFSLADTEALNTQLRQAGFAAPLCEEVGVVYEYDSVATYLRNRMELSGPFWDDMESAEDATRDAVFAAIETALRPYRQSRGHYRIENIAVCTSATAG